MAVVGKGGVAGGGGWWGVQLTIASPIILSFSIFISSSFYSFTTNQSNDLPYFQFISHYSFILHSQRRRRPPHPPPPPAPPLPPPPTFFFFILAFFLVGFELFDLSFQLLHFGFAFRLPLTHRVQIFFQNLNFAIQFVHSGGDED